MKVLRIVGNCCCMFLAIIGVLVSMSFGYYHFFVKGKTHEVNYLDNQNTIKVLDEDTVTHEEKEDRYFMEGNFFSNAKGNGIVLQELNFNYFTDYSLDESSYRSSGMQCLRDLKPSDLVLEETTKEQVDHEEPKGINYYDTTNHISWQAAELRNSLNRENVFIVKVGDRAFQLQLNKQKEWTENRGEWYTLGIPFPHHYRLNYTFLDVFVDCMEAIRSNDKGFGDYYLSVKISEYFTIREFNLKTGKYEEENSIDYVDSYAILKFHYDENGATSSQQSLFKCIDYNPNYGLNPSQKEVDTNYWQERVNYDLDESSTYQGKSLFEFRKSEKYQGYFIALTMDVKELFDRMPRAKVDITIDVDSEYLSRNHMNVVGLDYSAFENFEIDTLTILGSKDMDFYLLKSSLVKTRLQVLRHSKSVSIVILQDAIDEDFSYREDVL